MTESNVRWLMKFTHEFTHLLFAILVMLAIQRVFVDFPGTVLSHIV